MCTRFASEYNVTSTDGVDLVTDIEDFESVVEMVIEPVFEVLGRDSDFIHKIIIRNDLYHALNRDTPNWLLLSSADGST